jgi:hypothetical protein
MVRPSACLLTLKIKLFLRLFVLLVVFPFPLVDTAVPAWVSCLCPFSVNIVITFVDAVESVWKYQCNL